MCPSLPGGGPLCVCACVCACGWMNQPFVETTLTDTKCTLRYDKTLHAAAKLTLPFSWSQHDAVVVSCGVCSQSHQPVGVYFLTSQSAAQAQPVTEAIQPAALSSEAAVPESAPATTPSIDGSAGEAHGTISRPHASPAQPPVPPVTDEMDAHGTISTPHASPAQPPVPPVTDEMDAALALHALLSSPEKNPPVAHPAQHKPPVLRPGALHPQLKRRHVAGQDAHCEPVAAAWASVAARGQAVLPPRSAPLAPTRNSNAAGNDSARSVRLLVAPSRDAVEARSVGADESPALPLSGDLAELLLRRRQPRDAAHCGCGYLTEPVGTTSAAVTGDCHSIA